MERLTSKDENGHYHLRQAKRLANSYATKQVLIIQEIGKYEDAEEDGRLLILPCRSGDTVYYIDHDTAHDRRKIKSGTVWQFGYENYLWLSVSVSKNKVVILKSDLIYTTREAAEQALKEMED